MTHALVLLPFEALAHVRAGQLIQTSMIVDEDFVPFIRLADAAAGRSGVVMLVNQAFRKAGAPVGDARVPPATNSQHLVGRALDANLLAAGRVWGSGLDDPATAITPTCCPEVGAFLDLMRRAGFRWGGVWTPPDRIHWDAWINPEGTEYREKRAAFQARDLATLSLAPGVTVARPPAGVRPPMATPANLTPMNPTPANPTPANPTPTNPRPTNTTLANTTPANPTPADATPAAPSPEARTAPPAWLARDVQKGAKWLPPEIRRLGLDGAFAARWASLPDDVKTILRGARIPSWMIALVPTEAGRQNEILKQFRFMATLAGPPPPNPVAARAEQLLIFGGGAQLPTPGDERTGASLGPQGCTAAVSKYVIAPLKNEFPRELAGLSERLTTSQLSTEMRDLFLQAAKTGLVRVVTEPFASLDAADILPGSLTIARKPGGTHVFGWTRVPAGWRWDPSAKMAIGNTGLPEFGDRLILAQEYVTGRPDVPGELAHNRHGPINSTNVVLVGGKPDLSDPRTNPYAVAGSSFVLVNFLAPVRGS